MFSLQISAQESRRKKKEFVDTLEQKVSMAAAEVDVYKKRCEALQKQNASLITQLNSLRALLVTTSKTATPATSSSTSSTTNKTDTELMTKIKVEPAEGTCDGPYE